MFSFYLSTVDNLNENDRDEVFKGIEVTCVAIFTAEVFARTLVATLDLKRMLLLDIYWWIDALAIVPFYARLAYDMGRGDCIAAATANVSATNLTLVRELVDATCASELPIFLKFLQLLRLLRILKLMRHYVDVRLRLKLPSDRGQSSAKHVVDDLQESIFQKKEVSWLKQLSGYCIFRLMLARDV